MSELPAPQRFLDPTQAFPSLAGDGLRGMARRLLDRALCLTAVEEGFQAAERASRETPARLFDELLRQFDLPLDAEGVIEAIPQEGPAIIVANHPFGGADALSLSALALAKREDTWILGNEIAHRAPGFARWVLPLSILGEDGGSQRNASSMRTALAHLKQGGLLVVFPSGAVSTWAERSQHVEDGPWSPHIAALARRTHSRVLPVRYFGSNPFGFHAAGLIHPMIRTALLPRMLWTARYRPLVCRAGAIIEPSEWSGMDTETTTTLLRERTLTIPFPYPRA